MEIPKQLSDSIWDYCRLNNITDVNGFTTRMITQGFNVEKYGNSPTKIHEPQVIEKEVVKYVEKEVIKEVIKEVPVDKVVEKIVYISDKSEPIIQEVKVVDQEKIDEYEKRIQSLMYQLSYKTKELSDLQIEYNKIKSFTDTDKFSKLVNKIKNLEIELELEKNRHAELPKPNEVKSRGEDIIKWVSRDKENLYGDE